ncbi:MAG: hypothetical protein AAGJ37_15655 [Pseudomonadota bacterium]
MIALYHYYTTRYLMLSSAFLLSVATDSTVDGIREDAERMRKLPRSKGKQKVRPKQTARH